MRSRAEAILRGIALAALAALLVLTALRQPPGAERVTSVALQPALERWSSSARPGAVHVTIDSLLSPALAAWLAAIEDAGIAVSWTAPGLLPLAVTADAVADPAGATRVLVAAPRGTRVTLSDEWGALDSAGVAGQGARFIARSAPDRITVRAGGSVAESAVPDSLVLGRVLVLGSVSWESKFVVAALEERGWQVESDLALAPRGGVTQGRPAVFDTRSHSAVIVLDSSAVTRAAAISRFARQGGGVILSAAAIRAAPFAALAGSGTGDVLPPIEPYDSGFADPRRSLALRVVRPGTGAVPLEQREGSVAVAVRRVEQGRVAVFGYDDTWRWRLAGAGDAAEAHRDWWAGLVAAVAGSRVVSRVTGAVSEAPYAALVSQLGAPGEGPAAAARTRPLIPWLFALALAALLAEWASRRLRGRR